MKYYNVQETASRILKLRTDKGYKQNDVAEQLGIERGSLSHIERGAKPCSLDLLIRIAELYDVSLDYLISGKDIDGRVAKTILSTSIHHLTKLLESYESLEVSN